MWHVFPLKITPSFDHKNHASHHDFTIKKPRPTHHFFQDPHQKAPVKPENRFDGRL
jgi:hypothetical protein